MEMEKQTMSSLWLPSTNLERFLHSTTPIVPSRFIPRNCISELNNLWQLPCSKDIVKYFTLGDLWNCYDEWSAYGAGTQLLLNNGDSIMQYYVPYLSALQIYSNKSVAASRNLIEYSDMVEFESDSWSSEDSISDKLSRSLSNNSTRTWETTSEDSNFDNIDASSPVTNGLGYLHLEYFELSSPNWRVPLMEKIIALARNHPGILTLKNVDLSPASWMAVAWYPIYHIPSQRNEKDLSTCFLTYHTLSSSFQDCENEYHGITESFEAIRKVTGNKPKREGSGGISLPPFGLVAYKMQGDLWVNANTSDHERIICLRSAADSWLKQLNIQHHDFNFFSYHSTM